MHASLAWSVGHRFRKVFKTAIAYPVDEFVHVKDKAIVGDAKVGFPSSPLDVALFGGDGEIGLSSRYPDTGFSSSHLEVVGFLSGLTEADSLTAFFPETQIDRHVRQGSFEIIAIRIDDEMQ